MKEKLKFLQIDTSNENLLFVRLFVGEKLNQILLEEKRCHLKELIPSIEKLLEREKIELDSLDFIALNQGPGSWTGLRIGFATIKVLAQVKSLKIILYNNFELLMKKNKSITGIFLVKSSNQNFYYNVMDKERLIEQGIISEENLKNLYQNLPRYYLNENDFDAENLIRHKFINNEFSDVFKIEPYYIAEGVLLKN